MWETSIGADFNISCKHHGPAGETTRVPSIKVDNVTLLENNYKKYNAHVSKHEGDLKVSLRNITHPLNGTTFVCYVKHGLGPVYSRIRTLLVWDKGHMPSASSTHEHWSSLRATSTARILIPISSSIVEFPIQLDPLQTKNITESRRAKLLIGAVATGGSVLSVLMIVVVSSICVVVKTKKSRKKREHFGRSRHNATRSKDVCLRLEVDPVSTSVSIIPHQSVPSSSTKVGGRSSGQVVDNPLVVPPVKPIVPNSYDEVAIVPNSYDEVAIVPNGYDEVAPVMRQKKFSIKNDQASQSPLARKGYEMMECAENSKPITINLQVPEESTDHSGGQYVQIIGMQPKLC